MNTIIHKIEESETLKKKFIKLNTIKIDINSQVEELKASENAPKLFNAILNTYKLANFHFSYGSNPDQCNQVNNLRTVFPRIRERSFERDMYIDSPNQISIKNLREYDGW